MKTLITSLLICVLLVTSVVASVPASETIRQPFPCNGSTTEFTFNAPSYSADDIYVYTHLIATGVEELLIVSSQYTIAATDSDYLNGGVVTTVATYASTYRIVIVRNIQKTQETVRAAMSAQAAIDAVDKLTRIVQDLEDRFARSIHLQESDGAFDMELPGLALRASTFYGFGTDGAPLLTNSVASDNTVVSTFMETFVDDADGEAGLTTLGGMHVFNVKDPLYGAVGDDVADDTAPIQAAIDAAEVAGGGIVFVPTGTYKLTSALVNDFAGVYIIGASKRITILKQYGTAGEAVLEVDATSPVDHAFRSGLFDIQLEGNASSGNGLTLTNGYHYNIARVLSRRNGADGFDISGYVYYLNMTSCEGRVNSGHGCHMYKGPTFTPNNNSMYNCHFIGNTDDGLYAEEIDSLDIYGGSFQANDVGIRTLTAYALNLWGGYIENNSTDGIICPPTSGGCVFRPSRLLQSVSVLGSNALQFSPRLASLGDIHESALTNFLSASVITNRHAAHGNEIILPAIQATGGGTASTTADSRSMMAIAATLSAQNDLIVFGHTFWISPKCVRNGIYKVTVYAKASIGNANNLRVECKNTANNNGRLLNSGLDIATGNEFLPYFAGFWTVTETNNFGLSLKVELKKLLSDADTITISHVFLEPIEPGSVVLLSTINVSLAANADTSLFTVPSEYRCILDHAKLVAGADAGTSDISIGANGAETDFIGVTNLDNLDAANDMVLLAPVPSATPATLKSYAAGTVIEAQVANQVGGATNTLYLYGTLY